MNRYFRNRVPFVYNRFIRVLTMPAKNDNTAYDKLIPQYLSVNAQEPDDIVQYANKTFSQMQSQQVDNSEYISVMEGKDVNNLKQITDVADITGPIAESSISRMRGRPVIAARLVTWILKKVVEAHTTFVSGLQMTVLSESNRDILRGLF